MSKKTVVEVDLLCSRCKQKVMKLISNIEGIDSIVLDPSKRTVTTIGEADPACVIKKVRKFRRSARFISVGPSKEEKKDDKKDDKKVEKKDPKPPLPQTCQRCDVWYVINDDAYSICNIL